MKVSPALISTSTNGKRVLFFSLEMSRRQLTARRLILLTIYELRNAGGPRPTDVIK